MKTINDLKVGDKIWLCQGLTKNANCGKRYFNALMAKYATDEPGEIIEICLNEPNVTIRAGDESPGRSRWCVSPEMIDWERTAELNNKNTMIDLTKILKVGDKVYCLRNGEQEILDFVTDKIYPLVSDKYTYTHGGKHYYSDINPTLFPSKESAIKHELDFEAAWKEYEEEKLYKKWEDFGYVNGYKIDSCGIIQAKEIESTNFESINGILATESQCKVVIAWAKLSHVLETYPEYHEAKDMLKRGDGKGYLYCVTKMDGYDALVLRNTDRCEPFIFSHAQSAQKFLDQNRELLLEYFENLIA